MHLCGFCSLLAWFCIFQALPWFSSTMVDLGSFLLGFHFFSFLFFSFVFFSLLGGSGVLSHGSDFLVYDEDIDVVLNIGTLYCTWLGDGAT